MNLEWEELSRETIINEFGRKLDGVNFRLPDGSMNVYYIIVPENEVVTILPITSKGEVVLVKQFRPGPKKVFIDTPGGRVNKGENAFEAAHRELFEETGYRADKMCSVAIIYTEPESSKRVHCMLALGCQKVKDPDKSEFTEVVVMSIRDFKVHLRSGKMLDTAQAYLALDHYSQGII